MRWVSLGLVLLLVGCAAPKVAPPSQETRERMRHLALSITASSESLTRPGEKPAAGGKDGAAYGAKVGAGGAVLGGTFIGGGVGCNAGWGPFVVLSCPIGLVSGAALGVAAALPAAAIGAAVGADKAKPEVQVAGAADTLARVLEETNLEEELRAPLLASIARMTETTVVAPVDSGAPDVQPRMYLDIVIERANLIMKGRLEPDLYIDIAARAGLREPLRPGWAYERTWRYYTKIGEYFLLLEKDGAGLQRQIDMSFGRVADTIVVDLFLSQVEADVVRNNREIPGRVVTTAGPTSEREKPAPPVTPTPF